MVTPKSTDLKSPFNERRSADDQGLFYGGTEVITADGRDLKIPVDFFTTQYWNLGTYAQLRQTFLDQKIQLTIGARFDSNSRYGFNFNPRAGIVVRPHQMLTIKALYGESYLAPSVYQAYETYGSFSPATDASGNVTGLQSFFWGVPNPDLKPQKLRSGEAQIIFSPVRDFSMTASGFYTGIENLIVLGSSSATTFQGIPVGFLQTWVNAATQRTYGLSLQADAVFKKGLFRIHPYASYSFVNGSIDDTAMMSTPLPYTAAHSVRVGVDMSYGKFSLAPRLQYRSASTVDAYRRNINGQPLTSDPFCVVNVHFLAADLLDLKVFQLSAWARVNNLLNARYYHAAFGSDEEFVQQPQDPITFVAGVTATF